LEALAALAAGRSGLSWAVLGEMRELGADARELHVAVGRHAAALGVNRLVVVGDRADGIADGARSVAGWTGSVDLVEDVERATALVEPAATPDDVVLVKASNALALWRVAESILADSSAVEARP
jgi:UDP-N-acetylmuramoyl-tripeptide--D-alanyl-D-alanine ligase